ncbi:CHAT domain-containing protein [Suillus variegatus]|nr:CHAT domain-containing protein [Suillus variegatus]
MFAPGHFNDCHPPLGESPIDPECSQDIGQINLQTLQVAVDNSVPDRLDDTLQVLGEEPGQPEQPQDLGKTNLVFSETPQVAINNSVLDTLDNTLPALHEELSYQEPTQDPGEMQLSGMQQVIITAVCATDLTLGLRRIPAGFHVVVKADGAEYQTSNKSVNVDQTDVEWQERIVLPCDPSSEVWVSVYASFELGPMVCHGELLRTFEISVGELLDRSEKLHPIIFQPKQEEVVSACTSLFMRVEEQLSDQNDTAVLRPPTVPCRDMEALALMTDVGHRLLARYCRTQTSGDLQQSIQHFQRASDHCPMDHPYRPAALFNLATAKFLGCEADGTYFDLDLDIPISLFQGALDSRATHHPDRSVTQLYLAIALFSRFAKRGFETDADAAKGLLSEVLEVCHANSHIYRAALIAMKMGTLHSAGRIDANEIGQERPATSMVPLSPDQLRDRAEWCLQRDEPDALDEVISLHYDALRYYNTGHAYRGGWLCNLSVMLKTRFERRGNGKDLDEAIALQTEALALCPVGHTDRSMLLNNLASELFSRFQHRGNDEDLDETIALQRETLALRPSLNNLACGLFFRFHHRGNDENLDEAIALQREALALRPVGHTDRSQSLNNLAGHISSRFEHRGNDEDLDEAIALQREALALRPVGYTDRSLSLHNLANQLSSRFEHRGNDEDLDEAIALQREALALFPVGHTRRSASLNNLAGQLSSRFEHRGSDEDLDEAIALHREALALRPVGHTDRSTSLNNLADRLSSRFEHRGNVEDLDEAIALHREALALRPVSHTNRSASLNSLGVQLSSRFEHRGNDEDLDEAIALHREALALRPVGHTHRSTSLNNLGVQLSSRFEHRGNVEDLDESRENLLYALTLLSQHDPRQLVVHWSLAEVYLLFHRSEPDGTVAGENSDNLDAAMQHMKAATNIISGGLRSRLRESLRWVRHASEHSHSTQLEAYATSMQLLDAYMSVTASVSSRHNVMKEFPSTLAVDAASCALRSGDVRRAVELLEQGRTIIWTQMARLRTPLDSLQSCGDHAMTLMKKFRDLSSLLNKPASHSEDIPRVDVEAGETRYRRLVENWNGTVEDIRKIEGFSRFLLPLLFSDLQDAGRDGPIIVLIASRSSCDAIIIPHEQPLTSIQLPTNFQKLAKLEIAFREAVPKDAGPKGNQRALMEALRKLWNVVVRPVVDNLGAIARRGPRIWWCPTSVFNFLPLHAAGEYRKDGESLSRHYISSYTPSLTSLIKARASHDKSPSVPFVAIGQNHPAGVLFTLDAVEPELELVRTLLPPPPIVSFSKITSVDATKLTALCALQDNTWFHLACHGTQRFDEPFQSAFLMRDQPLSLLDIAQMDLSHHEFAFLSACETAVGVPATPDEVIHLAAGLQFAGVKSVIGTLWKVDDPTVQRLVKAFYANLCGDGTMNSKRAARALHRAVQLLASDRDIPLAQRIVFVHIGI